MIPNRRVFICELYALCRADAIYAWLREDFCVQLILMEITYSVLVVEDDPGVAKGLVHGLKEEGFQVDQASSGNAALERVKAETPHIVLLDIRLPDMNGFDVCRLFREMGRTMPVIMVTARDEEIDRILGLEIGADDYIVKPFSFRELVSRVRAQLRRAYGSLRRGEDNRPNASLKCGDVVIDRMRVTVIKNQRRVNLTPIEYKILVLLAENEDIPIGRDRIADDTLLAVKYMEALS